jgi:hypothetical protein
VGGNEARAAETKVSIAAVADDEIPLRLAHTAFAFIHVCFTIYIYIYTYETRTHSIRLHPRLLHHIYIHIYI